MSLPPRPRPERKLLPENNMTNSASSKGGGKNLREETGEQWRNGCDTTRSAIGLGGNPKVCCTGVRAQLSKTHWQKHKAQFPQWPFPRCCSYCIFILLLSNCFPSDLYTACLCFLIFVDVLRLLLCWTWSRLYSGFSEVSFKLLVVVLYCEYASVTFLLNRLVWPVCWYRYMIVSHIPGISK